MNSSVTSDSAPQFWQNIDTVLFDMDGTLLDLHFDSYFWKQLVPDCYAKQNNISFDEAWGHMEPKLNKVAGTLEWYCFDFWSRELNLDIMAMKRNITHKISYRPQAEALLQALHKSDKRVIMATNCNRDGLNLKDEFLGFVNYFDALHSSHDFGHPKEDQAFWSCLQKREGFDPARTLFVDDNLEILRSARTYGIEHLLAVSRPDMTLPVNDTAEFAAIDGFGVLLPLQ